MKTPPSRGKRPFVFINMAMTADGKIATTNRAISSFGSKRDLRHLYELRTTADAVMAGARTLDLNKVLLGNGGERYRKMRLHNGLAEHSLRVIVSGSGSIAPNAAIFHHRFSPMLLIASKRASAAKLKALRPLVDDLFICDSDTIDFANALEWLREKWNVQRLLCEGGGELNAALFRAGLVDELNLTLCPKIFGGRHAPTIADGDNLLRLTEAAHLKMTSRRQVGDEVFLKFSALSRSSRG
jgi:2,5-diamino-6-(ribosylamino)-4(3H)-pyrimidinone 5'-phosphate reductase